MSNTILFIHSSFRTGSTWFFEKLRRLPTALSYYEIFHERLNTIDLIELNRFGAASWDSNHPAGEPYFKEFAPLLRSGGGVRRFRREFSYARMTPGPAGRGEISEAETRYIESLVEHARKENKIPVLTGCRTLARAPALKARFGGFHIVLQRPLRDQWNSYVRLHDQGSFYFLNSVIEILANANHDPFQKTIFDSHVQSLETEMGRILRFENWDVAFEAFVGLMLHHYVISHRAADLHVDPNRLAVDRTASAGTSECIAALVGARPDFRDANPRPAPAERQRGELPQGKLAAILHDLRLASGGDDEALSWLMSLTIGL